MSNYQDSKQVVNTTYKNLKEFEKRPDLLVPSGSQLYFLDIIKTNEKYN